MTRGQSREGLSPPEDTETLTVTGTRFTCRARNQRLVRSTLFQWVGGHLDGYGSAQKMRHSTDATTPARDIGRRVTAAGWKAWQGAGAPSTRTAASGSEGRKPA